MNWNTKLDQQRNALLLTFYMFIAMTLVVIRFGLTARGLSPSFPFAPQPEGRAFGAFPLAGAHDDAPPGHDPPPSNLSDELDQLYAAALALLWMARAVARQLAGLECEIYELMKLADAQAQSLRDDGSKIARPRDLKKKRLDAP